MTIDEAIHELKRELLTHKTAHAPRTRLAINLGIQALEKWRVLREGRAGVIDPLLPGETKE